MRAMEIRHYLTASGRDLFQSWLDDLRDIRARVAIQRRIDRLAAGNFGDHKFCRDGISELRIDVGAGYRVYYAKVGQTVMLIVCGGDKRTQTADIERAVKYWADYQRRLS
jgi:putative addiction module killer protein